MSTYIGNMIAKAREIYFSEHDIDARSTDEHWARVVQAVLDECPPPPDEEKVSHPSHYQRGRVEVAVAMDVLGHPSQWLGHALKYACRAPHKGSYEEDCRKAAWCARRAIELNAEWSETRFALREVLGEALVAGIPDDNDRKALRSFVRALCAHPLHHDMARDAQGYLRDIVACTIALEDSLR